MQQARHDYDVAGSSARGPEQLPLHRCRHLMWLNYLPGPSGVSFPLAYNSARILSLCMAWHGLGTRGLCTRWLHRSLSLQLGQWSGALWVSGPLARASPCAAASVVKVGTHVFPGFLLQANHHAFGSERVSKAMTDV